MWFLICFNALFWPKFTWMIWCIIWKSYYLLIFHDHTIIPIICHQQFSFFFLEIYIFLFLGISEPNPTFSSSFVTISKLFFGDVLEAFVFFSAILLRTKLPFSLADYLAWSIGFWLYLPLTFLLTFLPVFSAHIFSKRQKSLMFSLGWNE